MFQIANQNLTKISFSYSTCTVSDTETPSHYHSMPPIFASVSNKGEKLQLGEDKKPKLKEYNKISSKGGSKSDIVNAYSQ